MRHGDDGSGEALKKTLQPRHGLGVKMVGGFVQEQNVRALQQKATQGHAPALAAGKHGHGGVRRRATERVHGHFEAGIQIPRAPGVHLLLYPALPLDQGVHLLGFHGFREPGVDLLERPDKIHKIPNAFLHNLANRAFLVDQRLLLKIPDGVARGENRLAVKRRIDPGQDLEQRGLARAVQPQNADFCPVKIG